MKKINVYLILSLIISIFISGCHFSDENLNQSINDVDTLINSEELTKDTLLATDTVEIINYLDSNNLKQGKWVTKKIWRKDTIINIHTYVNDTLNGYFERGAKFARFSGFYKMGVEDGLSYIYVDGKDKHLGYHMVSKYIEGRIIWSSFGFDIQFIFPRKGFNINVDSIYLIVPYVSGKTWYEGYFITVDKSIKSNSSDPHIGIGIHKVYYENGNIKAVIDYDNLTIKFFSNEDRSSFKNYSFKEYAYLCRGSAYNYVTDENFGK